MDTRTKPSSAREIVCRSCQQTNDAARRFCSKCGESLWRACPECKEACPDGETFCGACGANLVEHEQRQIAGIEAKFARIEGLHERYQYDEAIRQLRAIASLQDNRLQEFARKAAEKSAALGDEQKRWAGEEKAALQLAGEHFKMHAYADAVDSLERIPELLRTKESEDLLQKAARCRDEVLNLQGSIKRAIAAKQFGRLGTKIDRLLVLQPGNEQVRALAAQLVERICRNAKRLVQNCKFSEALELLQSSSTSVKSDELDRLTEEAGELKWLSNTLQTAAVADANLKAFAERLAALAPKNANVQRLQEQIAQRLAEPPSDPRCTAPKWYAGKSTKYPVDRICGLNSLNFGAEVKQLLNRHPGAFYTAIGLALQGVSLGASQINLAVGEGKRGLLGGLSLGRRKKNSEVCWGLDLGNLALKAACVKRAKGKSSASPELQSVLYIPHDAPLHRASNETERRGIVQRTLAQFIESQDTANATLAASLPSSQLLGRFLKLPQSAGKKAEQLLLHEVTHQIPFPIDEVCWAHEELASDDDDENTNSTRSVMVLASKKTFVDEFQAEFKAAGLSLDIVQGASLALHNFAVHEFFPHGGDKNSAVVFLDVGAVASDLVVSTPFSPWFRSLAHGGELLTNSVSQSQKLTWKQAEQWKREPYRAERISELFELLSSPMEAVASEFQRSMASFTAVHSDVVIRRMFGIGGGFGMHGMLERFRDLEAPN